MFNSSSACFSKRTPALLAIALLLNACGGGSPGSSSTSGNSSSGSNSGPSSTTTVSGYGSTEFDVAADNQITSLQTTLTVPPQPAAIGTLFLWPGLQPGGANYLPVDNGVLQPVLTWGPSCAPGMQPPAYSGWWISAQYVNTIGHASGYTGCQGGAILPVASGDQLRITMQLNGSVWTQNILNLQSGKSVSYAIDLQGQAQNRALFIIESYQQATISSDVMFSDTRLSFAKPSACTALRRGINDLVGTPQLSADGLSCTIPLLILRSH